MKIYRSLLDIKMEGEYSMQASLQTYCVLYAQARFIRIIIWLNYHKGDMKYMITKHRIALFSMISSIVAMLFPSPYTFMAALAFTFIHDYSIAPYDLDNGGTFEMISSFMLFIGMLTTYFNDDNFIQGLERGAIFVRPIFILLYFAAAFAKANKDYMDYRKSSNTVFTILILAESGMDTDIVSDTTWKNILKMNLIVLAFIEWLIPGLFLFGYIKIGFIVNWLFHLALGIPAFDFSTAATSVLPYFLMMNDSDMISNFEFMTIGLYAKVIAICLIILLCIKLPQHGAVGAPVQLVWLIWTINLLIGLIYICMSSCGNDHHNISSPQCFASAMNFYQDFTSSYDNSNMSIFFFLIVEFIAFGYFILICLAPYIGLKTHATYTMFSNLRVEGNITNHYLWRPWMAIFPYTSNLITLVETDNAIVDNFMELVGQTGSLEKLIKRLGLFYQISANSNHGNGGHSGLRVFPYRIPEFELRCLIRDSFTLQSSFYVKWISADGRQCKYEVVDNVITVDTENIEKRNKNIPFYNSVVRKFMFSRALLVKDEDCGICSH
eukprot:g592.t1